MSTPSPSTGSPNLAEQGWRADGDPTWQTCCTMHVPRAPAAPHHPDLLQSTPSVQVHEEAISAIPSAAPKSCARFKHMGYAAWSG